MNMCRRWLAGAILLLMMLVVGCQERGPIKVGFVGGLSGRVADLGISGRNGVTLAIEQQNSRGGIDGRRIELLVRDDAQDPATARKVTQELLDAGVAAILGPMTSAMGVEMVPLANAAKVPLVSPTVTTAELSGQRDYFFRALTEGRLYAAKIAAYAFNDRRLKRVRGIYDLRNRAYAESWYRGFAEEFERLGGEMLPPITFSSSNQVDFSALSRQLRAAPVEGLLLVTNAMDGAMLCQQLHKQAADLPIFVSEWAATEKFLELGGAAVEGVELAQFFNRDSERPEYLDFREHYIKRFGEDPGFASVAGYDAANMLLQGMREAGDRSLVEFLQQPRTYAGVQQPLPIDRYGEAMRGHFLARIINGEFKIQR